MSSDDDADELAALRAQRAARTGTLTLSQLQEQQRRKKQADSRAQEFFADDQRPNSRDQGEPSTCTQDDGGDLDLQQHSLPLSFGKPGQQQAAKVMFGPPRPPNKPAISIRPSTTTLPADGSTAPSAAHLDASSAPSGSFGPPRPPQAASAQASEAAASGSTKTAKFGPPQPPPRGTAQQQQDGAGPKGDTQEDDMVGPPPPPSGGDDEGEEERDDGLVGPSLPRDPGEDNDDEDEDGDMDDVGDAGGYSGNEEIEVPDAYNLPITHEAVMKGHVKAVTCLAMEHSGSRLATGSLDYTVRMYDMNGMKSDLRNFREVEPFDGHPVFSVSWSPTGDAFIAVTGAAQAKIYDRDCKTRGEFVRGDMYIRDARNTKGHIAGLTSGTWHPVDRFTAMTASDDGTVRIWDTHNIIQKTVVKPTLAKPGRVAVTACAYNTTGTFIGAGLMDGTIQLWSVGGKFGVSAAVAQVMPPSAQMVERQGWTYVSKPSHLARGAHEAEAGITSLAFSRDEMTLLSRAQDGTLKVWDLRRFNQPVKMYEGLPCGYSTTSVIFSPDESLIVTGVNNKGQDDAGAVVFIDKGKNEVIRKVGMPGAVTALQWHPKINQIFVGVGNRKSGATHVLYDPTFSEKGVLGAVGRQPRKPDPLDFQPQLVIHTPHALPMFREQPGRKRQRALDLKDPTKTKKPEAGAALGRGKAGTLGATGGTLLTQHLLAQRGNLKPKDSQMDPREAILRHGDAAQKEGFDMYTAAYKATQPVPIYAQDDEEDEEEQ